MVQSINKEKIEKGLNDAEPFPSRDGSFIEKINLYIEENIDNYNFNVNELSDLLGLSTTQVYRKIKALTGYSPVEYIRIYKLNKAMKMLIQTEYSIKEISYKSGFNSPSYFGKCFKKEYGQLPKNYRSGKYR